MHRDPIPIVSARCDATCRRDFPPLPDRREAVGKDRQPTQVEALLARAVIVGANGRFEAARAGESCQRHDLVRTMARRDDFDAGASQVAERAEAFIAKLQS